MLWDKKAFLRLPNSATRAMFGDYRTYYYHGQVIDHQTHMGVDLASLEGATVPAANSGKVVFTGFFGIYGNTIIIDHGLGLQTLYAHLREIDVKEGQDVKRASPLPRPAPPAWPAATTSTSASWSSATRPHPSNGGISTGSTTISSTSYKR